jgi:hypothetical protein
VTESRDKGITYAKIESSKIRKSTLKSAGDICTDHILFGRKAERQGGYRKW